MPSPPVVISNCVAVRLVGTNGGTPWVNQLHARRTPTTVVDQALASALGGAIKTSWNTNIAPLSTADASLDTIGVRDLNAPNLPEFLDPTAPVFGSGTGDLLPPQTALCVTLRTPLAGKSHRGRVYLTCFNEAQNGPDGAALASAMNGASEFLLGIQNAFSANGLTLAVASRPAYAYVDTRTWTLANGQTLVETLGHGTQRNGSLGDVNLVQIMDLQWDTQRRRNNGRGNGSSFRAASTRSLTPTTN